MSDENRKRVEIRKALARAECFWDIICKAGVTSELGGKIVDGLAFDKLENDEKLLLVKISTLLVRGADDINKQFQEKEAQENQETQDQININETPQAPETQGENEEVQTEDAESKTA